MASHLQIKVERWIQDLKDEYSKAVRNNPQKVAHIESAVRILSFLVAGRFENGPVLSELIYSASNLLIFLNDNVFKAASKYIKHIDVFKDRLQKWLTMLEYIEVFLEMASRKKWGEYGAWVFITVIQITKTVLRFYLLLKCNAGIQPTPPIPPADREALRIQQEEEHDPLEDAWDEEALSNAREQTFTLKSSGRQIRTLQSAKENGLRTWNVPQDDASEQMTTLNQKRRQLTLPATRLTKKRLWGECLHVARPVAHLIGMYMFGQESWKPWLLASGMDMASNTLMGEPKDLTAKEQSELRRRRLMLLYYLLRSPFYDQYSKARIIATLRFIANHVPLSGVILRPLVAYLPAWQKMYFYVWTG